MGSKLREATGQPRGAFLARQCGNHPDCRCTDAHLAAGSPCEAIDHRRPEAGALPTDLVVKSRSNALATRYGGIPALMSLTARQTCCPGGKLRLVAFSASIHLLSVSMVRRPPCGIPSRGVEAQVQRCALQRARAHQRAPQGRSPPITSTLMCGPTVRRTNSSMRATRVFMLAGFCDWVCQREETSRRWA